jgi:hypothetical protein
VALLVIGVVAAGLATAVGLAVAGHSTAAVVVLAAFALGIALLSFSGIARTAETASPAAEIARPLDPVPAPDPAELERRLTELARERARRLVELGAAVEAGDERAAGTVRSRLRELDALVAATEAAGNSHDG